MADRIAVMERGRVRQVAEPATLYEYPSCQFVAGFIGKMNLFEATVRTARAGELELDIPGLGALCIPHGEPAHGNIGIAVRPEKIRLSESRPDAAFAFEATVKDFAYYGSETHLYLATAEGMRFAATIPNKARNLTRVERGTRRFVSWFPSDTLVLTE